MPCDHDATRASLRIFLAATERHAFQDFGDGSATLLLGNCRGCASTLAVEIDLARGSIVRGEVGALPRNPGDIDDQPARRDR